MINIQELKIGNYVMYEQTTHVITAITDEHDNNQWFVCGEDGDSCFLCGDKDVKNYIHNYMDG